MGWGLAAMMAYQWYNDQQNRKAAKKAAQAQPTYLRYSWNPAQKQLYSWMAPYMAGLFGQPGTAPSAAAMAARPGGGAFGSGTTTQTNPMQSRQYGGPVAGQAPYLVGEQGPEMFVPEQHGTVVPLQGGGNPGLQMGQSAMMGQYGNMPLTPRQQGGPVAPTGNVNPYGGAGGILGQMPTPDSAPTGNWYGDLDPNVRAGIEQPYERGMEMLESRLQGRGALGAQRAGISGAGADVLGQYMQQAAPSMARTGWEMGTEQRAREWEAKMKPYDMLPSMLPYMMPQGITTTGSPVSFPGSAAAGTAPATGTQNPAYLAWLQQQQLQYGPDGGQGPGAGVGSGTGGPVGGGGVAI